MSRIEDRLTNQLAAKGNKNPHSMAVALLKKAGNMDSRGQLTAKGKVRNKMSPEDRAKDRQARYDGASPSDYNYDPKTNRATKKK